MPCAGRPVAVSQLARLAVCEQQLVLDARRGERLTRAARSRVRRGLCAHAAEHLRVEAEMRRAAPASPRPNWLARLLGWLFGGWGR